MYSVRSRTHWYGGERFAWCSSKLVFEDEMEL